MIRYWISTKINFRGHFWDNWEIFIWTQSDDIELILIILDEIMVLWFRTTFFFMRNAWERILGWRILLCAAYFLDFSQRGRSCICLQKLMSGLAKVLTVWNMSGINLFIVLFFFGFSMSLKNFPPNSISPQRNQSNFHFFVDHLYLILNLFFCLWSSAVSV